MLCDFHHKIPLQVHISEKRKLPNSRIHRLDQLRFSHPRLSLGLSQTDVPAANSNKSTNQMQQLLKFIT